MDDEYFSGGDNEDEDDGMPSGDEESEQREGDISKEIPEDGGDPTDAIFNAILYTMGLGPGATQPKKRVTSAEVEDAEQSTDEDPEGIVQKCDDFFETWKKDQFFNSRLLRDCDPRSGERYQWMKVGVLCWVKDPKWDWWPGIVKRFKKALKAKNITSQAEASVMFLEPNYKHYLHYVKQSTNYKMTALNSFVSVEPVEGGRPDDQIMRSQHSWLTCTKYLDYTFYELSERMAVLCERRLAELVSKDSNNQLKLNVEMLGGLYWLAHAVWLKMNGAAVDLPVAPESLKDWAPYLPLLENVAQWRVPAKELADHGKQRKNSLPDDALEDEETDGGKFGSYDYIQVNTERRDPKALTYSETSQRIVDEREKFGQELLEIVGSPECKAYLRSLRDAPATSSVHTKRSRAWKKNEYWELMNQNIKSPSGPIVVDSQVFQLYRFMRCLRTRKDSDNVKFMMTCYDVWLPEAVIFAIRKARSLTYAEAEEIYAAAPIFVDEEIDARWAKAPLSMLDAVQTN